MEDVLLFLAYIVGAVVLYLTGAVHGWNARERHAERLIKELVSQATKEEAEDLTHIVIEKQNDMLYVYSRDTMTFMAQGKNQDEIEAVLKERFPGKRFACSEKTLVELGFLS
jgi:flagellar motor component MotA